MSDVAEPNESPQPPSGGGSSGALSAISGSVQLSRSKQTWIGAGSPAGFALRYVPPMRRLLLEMVGTEEGADVALTILIVHLIKAGYGGRDSGRLRDFLVLGVRSAAKLYAEDHAKSADLELGADAGSAPPPLNLELAHAESPTWVTAWREGLLARAWRSLERYQHAQRAILHAQVEEPSGDDKDAAPIDFLAHDALQIAMKNVGVSPQKLMTKIATQTGQPIDEAELSRQLGAARVIFAQALADEVTQTLAEPDPKSISIEIKALGLQKAFAGLAVRP